MLELNGYNIDIEKTRILDRVRDHYYEVEEMGYEVLGVFLIGSQNYGLSTYSSDVDTIAVIVPSFQSIVDNKKPVSTTCIRKNKEQISIKDVRIVFEGIKDQKINYLEILFTAFKVINVKYTALMNEVFGIKEEIARLDKVKAMTCMCGVAHTALKQLRKAQNKIAISDEDNRINTKNSYHIFRMEHMIAKYTNNESFCECLIPENNEELMNYKNGNHSYSMEEYVSVCEQMVKKITIDTDNYTKLYTRDTEKKYMILVDFLDSIRYNILRNSFLEETLKQKIQRVHSVKGSK